MECPLSRRQAEAVVPVDEGLLPCAPMPVEPCCSPTQVGNWAIGCCRRSGATLSSVRSRRLFVDELCVIVSECYVSSSQAHLSFLDGSDVSIYSTQPSWVIA